MKHLAFASVLLVLALWSRVASAASPAELALEQGRVAYERGNYRVAIATVRPLLYPRTELQTEDQVVDAHRVLALASLFLDDKPAAEEEARAVFALRPNFTLDPVVDPPAAVRFFDSIRKAQDERLAQAREREKREREEREAREAAQRRAHATVIERTYRQNSRLVAALPFGIGQFQNGHVGLGIFFATTQALAAALSVGCWVGIEATWDRSKIPASDFSTAEALWRTQLASGGIFWALAIAGVIDAQVRFVQRIDQRERELGRPKKKTAVLRISPFGVQGEF